MTDNRGAAAPGQRPGTPAWLVFTLIIAVFGGLFYTVAYFGGVNQILCGPQDAAATTTTIGSIESGPGFVTQFISQINTLIGVNWSLTQILSVAVAIAMTIWVGVVGVKTVSRGRSVLFDGHMRSVFFQAVTFWAVAAFLLWIIGNSIVNLAELEKKSGFGFLCQTSEFQIRTTLGTYATDYAPGKSSYLDVFLLGVTNTLVVALTGIIAATLIGFLMGVFRLSNNVVLRWFATIYIETLRNIPLLLQIFFWAVVLSAFLPPKRPASAAWSFGDFHVNIDGVWAPFPIPQEHFDRVMLALAGAILVVWLLSWLNRRLQAATGRRMPMFWIGLVIIIGAPAAAYVHYDQPLEWVPAIARRFGFRVNEGSGMLIGFTFWQLWIALVLYTGSFIAEIVRAGILAVPWGQTEASRSLGISEGMNLRKVVIPQAMRVIIPPLTSQFLNLTKNSSLAAAMAYPDVVGVYAGTALNQVGQEIEMIFMMMMFYLVASLLTAAFMNWFNSRMKLVER